MINVDPSLASTSPVKSPENPVVAVNVVPSSVVNLPVDAPVVPIAV